MRATWVPIPNPSAFVRETLATEAPDIPVDVLTRSEWILDDLSVEDITFDRDLIIRHDDDPIHLKRRSSAEARIAAGEPIFPLIVLGPTNYLVDGYARYRALRRFQVDQIQVLRQAES